MRNLDLSENFWLVVFGLFIVGMLPIFSNVDAATVFYAEGRFTQDGIDWCVDEKSRFEIIGQDKWLEHHSYSIEARIAIQLFSDPLWTYNGPDRTGCLTPDVLIAGIGNL